MAGIMGMIGLAKRSSVVAAIAGSLVFAVPMQSAHALDPGTVTLLTRVAAGGGVGIAAAAPEVLAAAVPVCATGVGCAVIAGAVVVGVGLYLTRDSWMPYTANAWGEGTGGDGFAGTTHGNISFTSTSSTGVIVHWHLNHGYGFYRYGTNTYASCNGVLQGNNYIESGLMGDYVWDYAPSYGPQAAAYEQDSVSLGCTSGSVTGFKVTSDGGQILWGDQGSPLPVKTTRYEVQCKNPSGTQFTVTGPESVTDGGAVLPTCVTSPLADPGAVGRCATLQGHLPGDPFANLSSNCVAIGEAEAATVAKYPNCVGGGVACTYVIRHNGVPCTIGASGCSDWAARAETAPSEYACMYGPYAVPLGACNLLERAYETINGTDPLTATEANTDGDPRTYTGPAPVIDPPTTPRVDPSPDPTTDPAPCVSGGACPVAATEGQDCYPSGYGVFNPVGWVLQPIKCALTWAFVPRTATMTALTSTATADLTAVGIAPLAGAISTNVGLIGGNGTGCLGPAVTFSAVGIVKPMHPFSACDSPMSTLASISWAVSTLAIVGVGGFAALRAIGAGFGFNVSMGRGKAEA